MLTTYLLMTHLEPPVLLKNKSKMLSTCRCKSRLTGPTSPSPGRNSTETVPVTSLRLAAGRGAEGAAAVGGGPAGFTFPSIVNATVAAAT